MAQSQESRIAVLEAKEAITQEVIEEIQTTLRSLDDKVGKIELKLEKSMSFVGGIAFTFSALGALFTAIITYLLGKIGLI